MAMLGSKKMIAITNRKVVDVGERKGVRRRACVPGDWDGETTTGGFGELRKDQGSMNDKVARIEVDSKIDFTVELLGPAENGREEREIRRFPWMAGMSFIGEEEEVLANCFEAVMARIGGEETCSARISQPAVQDRGRRRKEEGTAAAPAAAAFTRAQGCWGGGEVLLVAPRSCFDCLCWHLLKRQLSGNWRPWQGGAASVRARKSRERERREQQGADFFFPSNSKAVLQRR